jgi:hypothetical protein
MTVSEWKLANSILIDDSNYENLVETQELFSGAEIVKGAKFMDALLDEEDTTGGGSITIYLLDSEIGDYIITNDPEWNEELPQSDQKFSVKPKA